MTRKTYGIILWLLSVISPFALTPYLSAVARFAGSEPISLTSYMFIVIAVLAMIAYGLLLYFGMQWADAIGARFLLLKKNPDLNDDVFMPGLIAGALCAGVVLFIDALLPPSPFTLLALARSVPPAIGFFCLFFCILNQEVFLCIFCVSGIAVFLKRMMSDRSLSACIAISIILAALLFSIAHLPLFYYVTADNRTLLIVRIVLLNTIAGVMFGTLFWKKSFETAVWAHVVVDFVLFVLVPLYALLVR